MGWDATLRKVLQVVTSIATGIFILGIASKTTGVANEKLTDVGTDLIIGGLLVIVWAFIAFCRRHPEWFSDYYEYH